VSWRTLLHLPGEEAYRQRYLEEYCTCSPLLMHDRMRVAFYPESFGHAFYQDTDRRGNSIPAVFSRERGQRLLWIGDCLTRPELPNFRREMGNGEVRRLILVPDEPYVVVLRAVKGMKCKFLTAYVVESASAVKKIRGNPSW